MPGESVTLPLLPPTPIPITPANWLAELRALAVQEPPALIELAEVARLMSLAYRTTKRMASAGKLPAPVRLSSKAVRWRRAEILDWISAGCPDRKTWEARRASRK